jgi:hypothetical protein
MVWGPDWEFSQNTGVNTPTHTISAMGSLMTSESQNTRLTSHPKDGTRHRAVSPITASYWLSNTTSSSIRSSIQGLTRTNPGWLQKQAGSGLQGSMLLVSPFHALVLLVLTNNLTCSVLFSCLDSSFLSVESSLTQLPNRNALIRRTFFRKRLAQGTFVPRAVCVYLCVCVLHVRVHLEYVGMCCGLAQPGSSVVGRSGNSTLGVWLVKVCQNHVSRRGDSLYSWCETLTGAPPFTSQGNAATITSTAAPSHMTISAYYTWHNRCFIESVKEDLALILTQ